jgi:hypothetical protein
MQSALRTSGLSLGTIWIALILLAGAHAALPAAARADKVVLKNGRVFEGKIIEETADHVVVEFRKYGAVGTNRIERREIKEIVREASQQEEYEKKIADAKTAAECVELSKKATEENLPRSAQKALERAVKLEPENAEARALLKHKKVDGKWLAERDWKLKEGWREDPKTKELVSPEDWKRREAEKKGEANKSSLDYARELEGTGEWFVIETSDKNYKIRCNSTKEVADRYAKFMVQIRREYDKVFKKYPRYWNGQSTIYIFRNNDDFKTFAEDQAGVGGFYRPKSENPNASPDRLVAAFHGAFGTGDTRAVLAHEATHQMEHIYCDGTEMEFLSRPPWWMEGYACYFGDGFKFDRKGNLEIIIPRMRLNPIQQYLKQGLLNQRPISSFLRVGLRQYQMEAGLTYPYGWALIYYFKKRCEVPGKKKGTFETKPQKIKVNGQEKELNLTKVLDDFFIVMSKKPPAGAGDPFNPQGAGDYYAKELEKILGFPIDHLADDFKDFILKLEPPSMGVIDKRKRKFSGAEAGFEVVMPEGKAWTWKEEDCVGDEAIRMVNADISALVKIEVDGNMENDPLESDGSRTGVKDAMASRIGRMWQGCTFETDQKTVAAGIESAWEFVYTGTPTKTPMDPNAPQTEQKVWHIVIGGATEKRTYSLIFMADKDKFDGAKPAFEQILNSFKKLKEN